MVFADRARYTAVKITGRSPLSLSSVVDALVRTVLDTGRKCSNGHIVSDCFLLLSTCTIRSVLLVPCVLTVLLRSDDQRGRGCSNRRLDCATRCEALVVLAVPVVLGLVSEYGRGNTNSHRSVATLTLRLHHRRNAMWHCIVRWTIIQTFCSSCSSSFTV